MDTGYAIEDATVNGYYAGNGITININSPRALNAVVGHEVTHAMKGSQMFDALSSAAVAYAKANGSYNSRLAALRQIYKGKPGYETDFDTKLQEELVADIIGDHLFTDEDFVRQLAAEDRNLFQKIFDEIKHLVKMATAGSKEARQLEKLKHTFEKVWNETKNTAQQPGGVKYSISKTSQMDFAEQLALIENGKLNGSNSLYVGVPSTALQNSGLSNAPFAMNQGDYRKSRRAAASNKKYSSHSVPYDFFKSMPRQLNNSPMLIDNGNKVTVITSYKMPDTKGTASVVIAGIWQNQSMDDIMVNQIKSVYPLDDCAKRILTSSQDGKLVVLNENKAKQILASIGVQPSEQSRIISLAKTKISQRQENVNSKMSLSEDAGGTVASGSNVYGADVALYPAEQDVQAAADGSGRVNLTQKATAERALDMDNCEM